MKYPSKNQLAKSQSRRLSSLMVRTLQKFEDAFPDLENTREGRMYKGDIKAMFNDIIRAGRDELNDYIVDYRPLHLTDDNLLAMTRTYLQTVQKIEFGIYHDTGEPFVIFFADKDKINVLDALRAEFGTGVVCVDDDVASFTIVGTEACVSSVLSRMDKLRVHDAVRQEYRIWRQAVVNAYRR
jgi:hypothetical protein